MLSLEALRPFGDRVVVRPDAKLQETDSGFLIPDVVLADNPNYFYVTGTVLKVGDGVRDDLARCHNQQCQLVEPRRVNGRCSRCGATQDLMSHGERRAFGVQVGDRVLFNRFAGKQVEADGSKVLIMREAEVLGTVDGDHRVLPGYEAPQWSKPTSNAGDRRPK